MKYSDVALLGKEISFETKDGKTATLTMKGTFDMSVISGLINGGSKSALIPNLVPGVIPGEITTTISNVPLTLSGEKYTFEGTDSGNGREVKYTGSVEKDKLVLSLNVTMPKNDLTGNWNLAVQQPLNLVNDRPEWFRHLRNLRPDSCIDGCTYDWAVCRPYAASST